MKILKLILLVMLLFPLVANTEDHRSRVGFVLLNSKQPTLIDELTWARDSKPIRRLAILKALQTSSCFNGTAKEIYSAFFDPNLGFHIQNVPNCVTVGVSADGQSLGLGYVENDDQHRAHLHHFRIESCGSVSKGIVYFGGVLDKANDDDLQELSMRVPATNDSAEINGFDVLDKLESTVQPAQRFTLRADYKNSHFDSKKDRPWDGMDISTSEGALSFALVLQQYVYENMGNQNPTNADDNFIAEHNTQRYWCHMPWLNVGAAGREAIHGLTNERILLKSPIYPNATFGSDWGVAYYNAKGCETIKNVFGTQDQPEQNPHWQAATFPDGTLSYKLLFTTSKFPAIDGAMIWQAHVSPPNSAERSIRNVRHIQMDISVKDSSLKGLNKDVSDWVMVTYYYDASYSSPLKIKNLQPGLLKMRPQGIQTGFASPQAAELSHGETKTDSIIFSGANNNGYEGRLNGPADNSKSSCLSCHAAAGTAIPVSPGIMSLKVWNENKTDSLDFNQQMALAKRNYETSR